KASRKDGVRDGGGADKAARSRSSRSDVAIRGGLSSHPGKGGDEPSPPLPSADGLPRGGPALLAPCGAVTHRPAGAPPTSPPHAPPPAWTRPFQSCRLLNKVANSSITRHYGR